MYALYERRWLIGLSLVVYLIAEFSVAMWIYSVPGNHRKMANTTLLQLLMRPTTAYKPAEALEDFDAFRSKYSRDYLSKQMSSHCFL